MKININVFDGIKYTIDLLLKKNLINDETTIIIPIIDLFEDILKIKDCYKNKLIFVLYQRDAINVPFDTNIELITIPEQFKIEEIYNMASDIKEEYDNAYLLDLSNDKEYINYYSKVVAKDLYNNYQNYNKIYIPYVYGGMYKGISRYFKLISDMKVILISNNLNIKLDDLEYDEIINEKNLEDEEALIISCKH